MVVTVIDSNTCFSKDSVFVTTNPSPPTPLGDTSEVCSPGAITLIAGPVSTYTYQWSNSGR